MNDIRQIFLYTVLALLGSFTANGLQCLNCQDMPKPEDCRIVTTCSSNSQCYVEQVVSSGGLVLYNLGCLSTGRCTSKRSLAFRSMKKRQGTVSETDIVTCVNCCNGDYCNIEGCGTTAMKQPKRPPLCFSCASQLDPHSCRDVSMCEPDHMCSLIETTTVGTHRWKSQCTPTLQCQILGDPSLAVNSGLCYKCCQDDFCNNKCDQPSRTQATVSSTSTVPSSVATKALSSTVTFRIPTKHFTTTRSPTVTTLMPMNNTLSVGITTLNATAVATVNTGSSSRLLTSPHSTTLTSAATHKLEISDTTTSSYSSANTNSNVNSSTSSSASTNLRNVTSQIIHFSHATKPASSTATSTFSNQTSVHTTSMSSTQSTKSITDYTTIVLNTAGCINRTFDICFVIDSSGSVGQHGFDKELQFISELVKSISMETNATTHFCVVTFSTNAHVFIKLTRTVDQVINAINTLQYRTGETYVHFGLHQGLKELQRNGRSGAEKEVILITDGISNKPTKSNQMAQQIKSEGIGLYAVGVGSHTNDSELELMVTDKTHLFEVRDFDHLTTSQINLIEKLCKPHNQSGTAELASTTISNQIITSGSTYSKPTALLSTTETAATTTQINISTSVIPQTDMLTTQTLLSGTSTEKPYTIPLNSTPNQSGTAELAPTTTSNQMIASGSTYSKPIALLSTTETAATTTKINISTSVIPQTDMLTTQTLPTRTSTEKPNTITPNSTPNQSGTAELASTTTSNQTIASGSTYSKPTALLSTTETAATTTKRDISKSVIPQTDKLASHTLLSGTSTGKPYTVPPNSITCAACSGPEFLCEKLYEMKKCDPPNNYCVNKLSNHKDGTRMVTRGCATFETCYRDWYLGSSDSDKCRKFDNDGIVTLEFDCTFCCIHDNCNVPIRPVDASLYKDL